MGERDGVIGRLQELCLVYKDGGLSPDEMDELFHLQEFLIAERDELWRYVRTLLNDLIEERARRAMSGSIA